MNIFLFLGSFNPIHAAHVQAVKWALACTAADRVWVVVSPQNPTKEDVELASLDDRVAMARLATADIPNAEVTDFEKELPAPHYTISSVEWLKARYPTDHFTILCGSDIIAQLPHWHRAAELLKLIRFVEYPRSILPVSSTEIRKGEKLYLLDDKVKEYIEAHNLYLEPMELAKRFYAEGNFAGALNVLHTIDSGPARTMIDMIDNILAFRNTDIYNP